jgi:hypothetical protein
VIDGLVAGYVRAFWRDDEASCVRYARALAEDIGLGATNTICRAIYILAEEGRIPPRGAKAYERD